MLPRLSAAWTLGVALLSLWHLLGWQRVRAMQRSGAPVGPDLQRTFSELLEKFGCSLASPLLESAHVAVPMLAGLVKPVVLLPLRVVTGLRACEIEAILAHELAHLVRRDAWSNLAQVAVETLFFYHPAVWWIGRRARQERENAADDLALEICTDRRTYAGALAQLAEMECASAMALAATGGSVLARIQRIVRPAAIKSPASAWSLCLPPLLAATALALTTIFRAEAEPAKPPVTAELSAASGNPKPQSLPKQNEPRDRMLTAEGREEALRFLRAERDRLRARSTEPGRSAADREAYGQMVESVEKRIELIRALDQKSLPERTVQNEANRKEAKRLEIENLQAEIAKPGLEDGYRRSLERALASLEANPDAKAFVNPASVARGKYTILGQVARPGTYQLPDGRPIHVLAAVGFAGGWTRLSARDKVVVRRTTAAGEEEVVKVDMAHLRSGGKDTFEIQPGDVITVGAQVALQGVSPENAELLAKMTRAASLARSLAADPSQNATKTERLLRDARSGIAGIRAHSAKSVADPAERQAIEKRVAEIEAILSPVPPTVGVPPEQHTPKFRNWTSQEDANLRAQVERKAAFVAHAGDATNRWNLERSLRMLIETLKERITHSDVDAAERRLMEQLLVETEPSVPPEDPKDKAMLAQNKQRAGIRAAQDAALYSPAQRTEIESLYEVAKRNWRTPEPHESLQRLLKEFGRANQTGWAVFFRGEKSDGQDRIDYLTRAVQEFSDCFFPDGCQIGGYGRYLLAKSLWAKGEKGRARAVLDELKTQYAQATDHNGQPMSQLVEELEAKWAAQK